MGSGSTVAQMPRAGNEYILEWAPALKTLATLGLYVRPWILVDYWEDAKAVGRFEGDFFDPVAWRPEYPNPAFDNLRPDDAFWAARLVARFSDEAIRAIVGQGAVQRTRRRRLHRGDADQAPRQGPPDVADGGESARGIHARRRRHADVRERGDRRGHRRAFRLVHASRGRDSTMRPASSPVTLKRCAPPSLARQRRRRFWAETSSALQCARPTPTILPGALRSHSPFVGPAIRGRRWASTAVRPPNSRNLDSAGPARGFVHAGPIRWSERLG